MVLRLQVQVPDATAGSIFHLQADNRSYTDCVGARPGLIAYNPGTDGRDRVPCAVYTCADRLDENGAACKCSREVGRGDCAVYEHGVNGATCTRCRNIMVLLDGACVSYHQCHRQRSVPMWLCRGRLRVQIKKKEKKRDLPSLSPFCARQGPSSHMRHQFRHTLPMLARKLTKPPRAFMHYKHWHNGWHSSDIKHSVILSDRMLPGYG